MEYNIEQKFIGKYPIDAAIWCNANNAHIVELDREDGKRVFQIQANPLPTDEEIAAKLLEQAKAERAEYVSKIIVTVDGLAFDGDETSQDRMARSCVALNDGETVQWVLADNSIAQVTKEQLRQALRLAGEAQTAIWANPYLGETE